MRNFARFLQAWYKQLTDSIDTTSLFTAKFSGTFLYYAAEDASADPASWLTIVAGILATVGVFAPPPAAAGTNAVAGILTAAAGTAGMVGEAPGQDPRFTNFGEIQSKLGDMKIAVTTALDDYFDRLFVETPPEKHWERGTELARILEDGAFAAQDFTSTPRHEDMVNMIKASLINEMWNSGNVAIVKWSNGNELSTSFGYSPCFKTHSLTLYNKYAVVCEKKQNFLIVSRTFAATMAAMVSQLQPPPPVELLLTWLSNTDSRAHKRVEFQPVQRHQAIHPRRPGRGHPQRPWSKSPQGD